MKSWPHIAVFVLLLSSGELRAQSDHYLVERVPFSSGINDEFSPVFLGGGIVFCSNQRDNALIGYSDEQSRLFNIFFVEQKEGARWSRSRLFAAELATGFNDGPSTFDLSGKTIYFSRNNEVRNILRNVNDSSNTLGIYSARLVDGVWSDIRPFQYNDAEYTFSTPSLTPSGHRLYFASDRPGGMGGMDLYFCELGKEGWEEPVNMGPAVNTEGHESFPYANDYGKVFFASDGHPGLGGKDLFYTQEISGSWVEPVHLDSAINSPYDDFGLVADSSVEFGYFSTNRLGTDDIFSFRTPPVEFPVCDSILENRFCFTLFDEQSHQIDTIPSIFKWDFGEGIIRYGEEVRHCFPGPGRYIVRLSIYDEFTGDTISDRVEYRINLENREQAYIDANAVLFAGEPARFDAGLTNLSNFNITDYYWDFGDGFVPGGPVMVHTFRRKSEYTVKMGLLSAKNSSGMRMKTCVRRKIRVYNSMEEPGQEVYTEEEPLATGMDQVPGRRTDRGEQRYLDARFFFLDDLSERQKSAIENILAGSLSRRLGFDNYGISPSSAEKLAGLAGLLKEMPEIRLEMIVSGPGHEEGLFAGSCARELGFYFKNAGVDENRYRSRVYVPANDSGGTPRGERQYAREGPSREGRSPGAEGWVEFMFMKKHYN